MTNHKSCDIIYQRLYHHKDGSVGHLVPGIEVMITEEGEVAFKGDLVMKGYYKNPEATDDALIDGWYHTGDLGYVDEDNFIFLTGRKKNLIILSNGENVSPEELEEKLLRFDSINEVVVSADDGVICAEIYPETNDSEENLYTQIQNEIDSLNKQLPAYKQITRTVFRNTPFEKTTTKKIRR